jgi:hypothetical protein
MSTSPTHPTHPTLSTNRTQSAYSAWIGKPVVLLVVIRNTQVPMPCRIVAESHADVRVRIDPGWELDLAKELILAIEEDVFASSGQIN